jgi:PUB domain
MAQCRLDVLGKLVYNSACAPAEEKFKCIKTSNKKIRESVVDAPGGMDVLRLLGWEQHGDEELRCQKAMTMAQVRN